MPSFSRPLLLGLLPLALATPALVSPPLATPARADDPMATLLPDTVVTATRTPTPGAEVASSVTVVTAADIAAHQYQTLPDVLNSVPGLNVVQSGGPGSTASVFIRGTNSNHTKVLIDGVDANDPSAPTGAFDFSQILAADIARVEILRGPQGALYGSDTIGGVINIVTKQGSGPPHFAASVEGGSFSTLNETFSASGATERLNYDFSYSHLHSADTQVTPAALAVPGRPINPDAYDNQTYATRLGYKLTDTIDAGLVVRYVDSTLRTTSDDYLGPEAVRTESTSQELFTRASLHQTAFDDRFDQTFGIAYTDYRRRVFDPSYTPLAPTFYRGDRIKLDWQGNFKVVDGETITLGAEHQKDELDDSAPATGSQSDSAGFAQLQSQIGKRFFNTASIRLDSYDTFGSRATWRIAPVFLIPESDTKFKATYGTAFKAPTLDELYDSYPEYGFYANPNLRPETSTGVDAGFEQGFMDKRLRFGATWFRNNIHNLIADNATFTSYTNIGRATTSGVESFVNYTPTERVSLGANYTYTIARDDILEQELLRRPKHKASVDGRWRLTDALSVTAQMVYTGPWVDIARSGYPSGIHTGGYAVVNVAASYDLGHGVTAFARIDNLTDRHYQDPVGFLHPGIGVFAGLRASLDASQIGL